MILIKVEYQGDPDTVPYYKIFQHQSKSDEKIFFESANLVEKRILKNFKINIHETLTIFAAFIVSELRAGKQISEIQENSLKLLLAEKVMIGVPESLRRIIFKVTLDNFSEKTIILHTPIKIISYLMENRIIKAK